MITENIKKQIKFVEVGVNLFQERKLTSIVLRSLLIRLYELLEEQEQDQGRQLRINKKKYYGQAKKISRH